MATKPIFGYVNELARNAVVVTASTECLSFPAANVKQEWKLKQWRSNYLDHVITAQNNKIDFNAVTATIPSGTYRPANLAAEAETQMNTAAGTTDITVTFDPATRLFTFDKVAGSLALKPSSGANKAVSTLPGMGFFTSADTAGPTSVSNTKGMSTYGRMEITSGNNKLYVNGSTFTITAATYSIKSLISEIKGQMASDYNIYYDEDLHKFVFGKASGAITLNFGTTTNSIADTLGYQNISYSGNTGDSAYVADFVRIHTSEDLTFDLGTAATLYKLAFFGYNYTSSSLTSVQANSSASWGSPPFDITFTFNDKTLFYDPGGSPPNYQFVRHFIIDRDNPAGYVAIGAPWAGTTFTCSRNVEWRDTEGAASITDRSVADFGNVAGTIKSNLWQSEKTFNYITVNDRINLETMFDAVADVHPFVAIFDLDNNPATETRYVLLKRRPDFESMNVARQLFRMQIGLMESA